MNLNQIKNKDFAKLDKYLYKYKDYCLRMNLKNITFCRELLKLSVDCKLISYHISHEMLICGLNYRFEFRCIESPNNKLVIQLGVGKTYVDELLKSPADILKMFSSIISISNDQLYCFVWDEKQQKIFVFGENKSF